MCDPTHLTKLARDKRIIFRANLVAKNSGSEDRVHFCKINNTDFLFKSADIRTDEWGEREIILFSGVHHLYKS